MVESALHHYHRERSSVYQLTKLTTLTALHGRVHCIIITEKGAVSINWPNWPRWLPYMVESALHHYHRERSSVYQLTKLTTLTALHGRVHCIIITEKGAVSINWPNWPRWLPYMVESALHHYHRERSSVYQLTKLTTLTALHGRVHCIIITEKGAVSINWPNWPRWLPYMVECTASLSQRKEQCLSTDQTDHADCLTW